MSVRGIWLRAVAVATLLVVPAGLAAAAGAVPPSSAQVSTPVCQTALDPLGRGIEITAVMRPVAGNERLAIEFVLGRRRGRRGAFRPVYAKHLNRWITPSPATLGTNPADIWRLIGQAVKLSAPSYYRFLVKFRWSDHHGKVIGRASRMGPVCYQPELRPDLLVSRVDVISLPSGQAAYVAHVRNRGLTAAGPFSVELELAGSLVQSKTVAMLGPRSSRRVRLLAPPCTPGEPLTVLVDPNDQVDEYDFVNNTFTLSCPLVSSLPPSG